MFTYWNNQMNNSALEPSFLVKIALLIIRVG